MIRAFVYLLLLTGWARAQEPEWVSADGPNAIHTQVQAGAGIRASRLEVIADFCRVRVDVNEQTIHTVEPTDSKITLDLSPYLRGGNNLVALTVEDVEGPSALAASWQTEFVDGTRRILRTGTDAWKSAKALRSLGAVRRGLWESDRMRPGTSEFDEYNQWKEALGTKDGTDPTTFALAEGFEIELLRSAGPDEGSWVSMAFDPEKRITIGMEKQGLLRLAFDPAMNKIASAGMLNQTLKECRGLVYAHGGLYAQANNSKGLYFLHAPFVEARQLVATGGSVGHGRNDLALGPDDQLYMIHGDSVKPPEAFASAMPPVVKSRPAQGYLMRVDREHRNWEVVSTGLRNPYGIDFNEEGEVFTYDADPESELGLPWYRPTRVIHLVSGANYGWRQGDPHWMGWSAESLPALYAVGRGSPTSIKFGTHGNFPGRYRKALYILDWAYGRVIALHLVPYGASYRAHAETFLQGRPLNVTDLEFGPDGHMYLVTGGRGTRSALYRVRALSKATKSEPMTKQEIRRRDHGLRYRDLRQALERLHKPVTPEELENIWVILGHSDPWIRHAARLVVEHQPVERWAKRVRKLSGMAQLTAALALARVGPDERLPEAAFLAGSTHTAGQPRDELLLRTRIAQICLERKPDLDADRLRRFAESKYPHASMPVSRELAVLLGQCASPKLVPKTLEMLPRVESQNDRLHFLHVLSTVRVGWSPELRKSYFRLLGQSAGWRGDRNLTGFIKTVKTNALKGLDEATRKELEPLLGLPLKTDPAVLEAYGKRPFVKNWAVAELLKLEGGDAQKGRALFHTVLCASCHQLGDAGTAFGPNLDTVARRFNRRDLLEAIVEPSNAMAEIFRNHEIITVDGKEIVGRVLHNDFRKSLLTISTNPFDPSEIVELNKPDIVSHERSSSSPMPVGLLNSLSQDEIRDLLAFLEGR